MQTAADVAALDLDPATPVAYITQTTLSVDDTRAVIRALESRFTDIVRTEYQRHLLRHAESAVGRARAGQDRRRDPGGRREEQLNSNRLREIGVEIGVPSYLIANGSEVDSGWFREADVVGITGRRFRARGTGRRRRRGAAEYGSDRTIGAPGYHRECRIQASRRIAACPAGAAPQLPDCPALY